MRREGRVRGKPSSKSRRCKSRKSVPKRLGSHKRITADDPAFTDFREFDEVDEVVDSGSPIIPTVNSVIEMAFSKSFQKTTSTSIDGANEEAFYGMASTSIVGANLDIPAIEEAFNKHLGIYENAVEGDRFAETQFTRKWGAVLSEESWSDVEFVDFSDLDEEDDDGDDWFVVLDEDHG